MAIEKVVRSDLSGDLIEPGTGARVRVNFFANGAVDLRADLTDAEIERLVEQFGLKPVEARPYRAGEKRNRRT